MFQVGFEWKGRGKWWTPRNRHFSVSTCLAWKSFLKKNNWWIIALQCCVSFCHTAKWISHNYKYIIYPHPLELPFLLLSHPSRSSQSARLGMEVETEMSDKSCHEKKKKGSRCWVKSLSLPKKAIYQLRALKRKNQRRQWQPTSVLLPGKSHGGRNLVGCSPWGREESDMTERLHFHFSVSCIGEGNGNPLQGSCLENPRDGGAWWAAVYGVTQSWTRLKQLSSSSSKRKNISS